MSIADRINSMVSNLSSAYGKIAYLGVDLSEVDKNMQNLSTVLDTVYNDYPKVSDEGVCPSIEGSKVGRLNSTLKASDTTQNTTIGKSLVDFFNIDYRLINSGTATLSNGEVTVNSSDSAYGALVFNHTGLNLQPNTQYTFSATIKSTTAANGSRICNNKLGLNGNIVYSENATSGRLSVTFTTPNDMSNFDNTYGLGLYPSSSNSTTVYTDLMLALGTDTTYEPYTNGASPNPNYPQDIHTIKGNNTIEVCGLNVINLLNYTRLVNNSCTDRVINKNDISFTNSGIWGNISLIFENINKNQDYYLYYKVSSIVSRTCGIKIYGTDVLEFASSDITAIYDGVFDLQANEIKEKNGTFNSGNYKYIILRFWGNASATSLGTATEIKYQDVMLKKGTSEAPYEPYNGTTYPIYLGGNVFNLIDIEENKFIASGTGVVGGSSVSNVSGYIYVIDGLIYRLTFDYTTLLNSNARAVCFYDKKRNFINGTTISMTNKNQAITIPSGASYLRFAYDKNLTDISLSTDMTPIELCKISTYQDKLFKAVSGDTVYDSLTSEQKEGLVSGGWYKYGMIRKVVFNGSEGWAYDNHLDTPEARTIIRLANSGYQTSQYIASHFIQGSTTANKIVSSSVTMYLSLADSITGVLENDTEQEKLNKMKAWLNTHNVDFYYVLATPTITQIIDATLISQLEALYNAMSYNGQTNILQTNADLPFIISASALKGE